MRKVENTGHHRIQRNGMQCVRWYTKRAKVSLFKGTEEEVAAITITYIWWSACMIDRQSQAERVL